MTGRVIAAMAVGLALGPAPLVAQTDYYNTDAGRPVRVEDAFPAERYAFDLHLAPVRLERASGGVYHWELEPELAYGVLPSTQVEVGMPLTWADEEGEGLGFGGLHLSALHNFNVETRTLPAFGVRVGALLPLGSESAGVIHFPLRAMATRTFPAARVHLNAEYTMGESPGAGEDAGEASRWMAGVAVDRTFPIRAALLIADLFVEQPLHEGEPLRWTAEAGTRYQLSPFFALDAGVGRRFAGADQGWFLTFGVAREFAIRALMPRGSR